MNSKIHAKFANITLLLLIESWILTLDEVEFLALHGNVLFEILISVHASSEKAVRFWSDECLGSSEEQGNNEC